MEQKNVTASQPLITVLGGTGPIGAAYNDEFLKQGVRLRILARSPERIRERFPQAEVIPGSMLSPEKVSQAMEGADAAFLIAPLAGGGDTSIGFEAARVAIAAARQTRLPHLIFMSSLAPTQRPSYATLDAKHEIEAMMGASAVPWTSLRCGSLMEDWLGYAPWLLKRGFYFLPLDGNHISHFTSQQDVARVVCTLVRSKRVINGPLDVIDPNRRNMFQVADAVGKVLKRKVFHVGHALLPLLRLLRPTLFRFYWRTVGTKVIILNYFEKHDFVGDSEQLGKVLPDFKVTTLEAYLEKAFNA
ncbi:MAG: NAD(P)H-binding protein [Terracidiphilus sp.]